MSKKKNILEEANEIIFQRAEEKQRDYGPINQSFEETATIASILTGKQLTPGDCYKVMIALKMSRMKRGYKRDTYVDAVGYMGALGEYLEGKKEDADIARREAENDSIRLYSDEASE